MTANNPCPNAAAHTPAPKGYVEWHEWALIMSSHARVERCPGCSLWVIWRVYKPFTARQSELLEACLQGRLGWCLFMPPRRRGPAAKRPRSVDRELRLLQAEE